MDPVPNEPDAEFAHAEGVGSLRWVEKASGVAVLAFALILGLLWLNRPLLLKRHPDRALTQCAVAALVAFCASGLVYSQERPGD
jgi:hypothetical protein